MGIISLKHTDQLYWLGRYSERVYTTLKLFAEKYDSMIDLNEAEYEDFCKKQDIPNIYSSSEDFAKRYCFDENDTNSIISNLTRAYDNAVVLREEIGSTTLSYIQLAVYAMNKAKLSEAPLLELQHVRDNIVAFWGIVDDSIDDEHVRSIIKLGKRIERVDLFARMHMDRSELKREILKLNRRIDRTGLTYSAKRMAHINYLIEEDDLNYKELVGEIEALLL
ncbi:MAG: alpha-E domain-containing protein [Lachnospiraceae bacterium]|nr:alpha-E domain-containing protein [Lachnospiraceae bacterium]